MSSYPKDEIQLEYRDRTLAPVVITIHPPFSSPKSSLREDNTVGLEYHLGQKLLGRASVVFGYKFLCDAINQLEDNPFEERWSVFWQMSRGTLESIAKWLLFHTDLANSEEKRRPYQVLLEKQDLPLSIRDGHLVCGVADEVMREEMKLARIVALKILYELNAQVGSVDIVSIRDRSHFPPSPIETAIYGMKADNMVVEDRYGSGGAIYSLSTTGQKEWERIGSMSQCAFIVGSCKPEYKDVIELTKEELRDARLQPIFQEHEEPNKDIYIDIFDHLRDVPLVVADISEPRPNIFVEIGYAKALNKRIIGLIREESWDKLPGYHPVPFDLFAINFTRYQMNRLDDLRKILKERIKKNKEVIQASQNI